MFKEFKEWLAITLQRLVCKHDYVYIATEHSYLDGPYLVTECAKCKKMKYIELGYKWKW